MTRALPIASWRLAGAAKLLLNLPFDDSDAAPLAARSAKWGDMGKTIYLTGAPASGKSTTAQTLLRANPDIAIWEYGARLTDYLKSRSIDLVDQSQLRAQSAAVVTPEDIENVDIALLDFVIQNRSTKHVLIDSHAVTKETFGFRITPFSLEQFAKLQVDEIWVFYASPQVTRERIAADSGGRPTPTEEEARLHTTLQASVAATYGMSIGRAVHLFDTTIDRVELVDRLLARLK